MKLLFVILVLFVFVFLLKRTESFTESQGLSDITKKVQELTIYAPKRQLCNALSCSDGKFCNSSGRCEPYVKMPAFCSGDSGKYCQYTKYWSSAPFSFYKDKQFVDIKSGGGN